MITEEQNPATGSLDQMTALDIARTMNAEDQRVALAVERALPQIAAAIDMIAEKLAAGGRLLYIGAGTSGRLGVLDAVECVPTFGTSPEQVQGIIAGGEGAFVRAVEGAEDDPDAARVDLQARNVSDADVVVGIAASGRTPYVLGALAYAREIGAPTVGIACNQPAPVLDAADIGIGVPVGPEVLTGSTRLKAGTAQKMVLNMLSTGAMVRLGKVYGNLMVDVQITNEKLAARARRIVAHICQIDDTAAGQLLHQADQRPKVAVVMGRRGVTREEAITLLEAAGGHLRAVLDHP